MADEDLLRSGTRGRDRRKVPTVPDVIRASPAGGGEAPDDDVSEPLDEFGLPVAWRRDEPGSVSAIQDDWRVFESWATRRGLRAFPAAPVTVALFIADLPVSGPQLRAVWEAIDLYHSAFYWNEGANPILELQLGFGVEVADDGEVSVSGATSPPPDD